MSSKDRLYNSVVVRPPIKELIRCVSTHPLKDTVDYRLALKQHEDYVRVLQEEGIEVYKLPQLEGFPDSVFIQDTAVVRSSVKRALISRFGAPSRRGEESSVREFLSMMGFTITDVVEPATLEGGDVLVTGEGVVFVGITSRTNSNGVEFLRSFFKDLKVVAIPNNKVFHLLSAVNYVGNKTLVIVPEYVDPSYFNGFRLIRVALEEAYAANMLYLGNNKVLIPEGYPKTVERMRSEGYKVIEVDISEFRKCDGGVTCLSLPFYEV
ncbi:MAG: dimethylarginine dimethylaminohydrolase family protein [Zestosphaera sp.]